ncbi:MAG: phospholipase D family protein [Imperialibacter sp.]|uniref:phospholipase D family protein n=1 Tax=Imperialibacter sp. TaxID=2038411 RepID=UPI003A85017F
MGKFLKGSSLNAELETLFESANDLLYIISPYIKLHVRFRDILKAKIQSHKLEITVVFGKNEGELSKSLNSEDLEFLKTLPNVEIRYEPRLHAKYYANETSAILSSMNLYDYSQNNNIEFGILTRMGRVISDPLDEQATRYFEEVIENSRLLYKKEADFEEKLWGISSTYIGSKVTFDELQSHFQSTKPLAKSLSSDSQKPIGYCIRTGVQISFNPKMPFADLAYKEWNKYKRKDYPEKFCHFSGEVSNGENSFERPILKKNWNQAKSILS